MERISSGCGRRESSFSLKLDAIAGHGLRWDPVKPDYFVANEATISSNRGSPRKGSHKGSNLSEP
jgi:hypothetical protein